MTDHQPDIDGAIECPACSDITLVPVNVIVNDHGRRDTEYLCGCGYTELMPGVVSLPWPGESA